MIINLIKKLKIKHSDNKSIKNLAIKSNYETKLKNDFECLELYIAKMNHILKDYSYDKNTNLYYFLEFKRFNKFLDKCIKDIKNEKNFHN